MKLKEFEAPPLGIKPQYLWKEERLTELNEAIARYYFKQLEIPVEWIMERNELIKEK